MSERPDRLNGRTYFLDIDEFCQRPLRVTINEQDGKPVEVFIDDGPAEWYEFLTIVATMATRLLSDGRPLAKVAQDMKEIHSPATNHFSRGISYPSLMARIGDVFDRHASKNKKPAA